MSGSPSRNSHRSRLTSRKITVVLLLLMSMALPVRRAQAQAALLADNILPLSAPSPSNINIASPD